MSIVKVTELPTVSGSRKFGEPPTFQRKWVVEVARVGGKNQLLRVQAQRARA